MPTECLEEDRGSKNRSVCDEKAHVEDYTRGTILAFRCTSGNEIRTLTRQATFILLCSVHSLDFWNELLALVRPRRVKRGYQMVIWQAFVGRDHIH